MRFSAEQAAVVYRVVDHILSLPEGTKMTTWQAVADLYPELLDEANQRNSQFMGADFLDWHFAICGEVVQRGYFLDYREHYGKLGDHPQNLDFTLRYPTKRTPEMYKAAGRDPNDPVLPGFFD